MTIQDERMRILRQVAKGELTLEEANEQLQLLEEAETLQDVETVETMDPAVAIVDEGSIAPGSSEFDQQSLERWKNWAAIPFWISVVIAAMGAYWMYQGWQAAHGVGLGFVLAWLPFLLGVFGMFLFWKARWLHIRIREKGRKTISISMPLPLRAGAWAMSTFGAYMPKNVREQHLDEVLDTMDQAMKKDDPIHIFVDDEEKGDQVEVYIG
jgi:hypothetical protein